MGNQLSGTSAVTPREHLPSIHLPPGELRWYEDTVKIDKDVREFDAELQTRTTRVINSLAAGGVQQPLSLSFDLLRELTGCLLDTDQRVVEVILSGKKDIWNNNELSRLVDDYFRTSLHTLDFFIALEKCLKNARDRQTILNAGIQRLADAKRGDHEEEYKKAMEDLERFRSVETHFTSEMLEMFGTVYGEQLQMLHMLQTQRLQLDKKIKKIKSWRKTANIIFAATFATVLICSIVAAALAAPPMVTAVVAALAATSAWAPTERWFGRLWKGFESAMKEQGEVISSMQAGTYVAIRDLDNIRFLVERLVTESMESESLQKIDGNAIPEETNSVQMIVQDIRSKICVFNTSLDELGEYVDICSRNIHKARSVVLQRIIKPPTGEGGISALI